MSVALTLKHFVSASASKEWLMYQYAKTGNHKYLSELYDQSGKDLYHFVLTLSDSDTAKDICQKAWLKVIEKRHLYQVNGKFMAWLFKIARHQLIDEYRKTRPSESTDELVQMDKETMPVIQQAFEVCLSQLPWQQREAFCLQQQGFSLNQICDITGDDYEAIKSRLRYAKKTLKTRLEKYYE